MSANLSGKRDGSLDMVAGVMILYVILGHMMNWSIGYCDVRATLEKIIPYFMPWFYFKSGMFYRPGDTTEVARHGWKKLVVPFLVFSGLGIILQCIKWKITGDLTLEYAWKFQIRRIFLMGSFEGSNPLWFLLSLFFVKVIFTWLRNHGIKVGVILGFCVTFLMANWLIKAEVGPKSPAMPLLEFPRYLYNVPCGMIFYSCGHLLKEKQYDWKLWVPALAVFLSVSLLIKNGARISFMHNVPSSKCDYFLFLAAALGQCISINAIFRLLSLGKRKVCEVLKLGPKAADFSILGYFGRNSIAIYTMHWPIMMIIWMVMVGGGLLPDTSIPEVKAAVKTDPVLQAQLWKEVAIYAAFCLTLIPLLCELISRSRLSWILGRERR